MDILPANIELSGLEVSIVNVFAREISFDEISVFFSELSDEEIEEIKSKIMQLFRKLCDV